MKKTGIFGKIFIALVLFFLYAPIIVVVIYSFNSTKSPAEFTGFSLRWYTEFFETFKYGDELVNSLIVGLASVVGAGIIGTLGAVALSGRKFKASGTMESISLMPIMLPEIILGVAFFAILSLVNIDGLVRLSIAHITFCIPYVYLIVSARLSEADNHLVEAARDLGARPARVFFTVILPLIAPGVIAGMLLSFAMSFDDVVISSFLSSPGSNLLPVKIYSSLIKVGFTPVVNVLFTLLLLIFAFVITGFSLMKSKTKQKD